MFKTETLGNPRALPVSHKTNFIAAFHHVGVLQSDCPITVTVTPVL